VGVHDGGGAYWCLFEDVVPIEHDCGPNLAVTSVVTKDELELELVLLLFVVLATKLPSCLNQCQPWKICDERVLWDGVTGSAGVCY
jgi:hypothetical protein